MSFSHATFFGRCRTLPPGTTDGGDLLGPDGVLILVEGRWQTGVGLTADECFRLVSHRREDAQIRMLDDPAYWGGPTADERYLMISRR